MPVNKPMTTNHTPSRRGEESTDPTNPDRVIHETNTPMTEKSNSWINSEVQTANSGLTSCDNGQKYGFSLRSLWNRFLEVTDVANATEGVMKSYGAILVPILPLLILYTNIHNSLRGAGVPRLLFLSLSGQYASSLLVLPEVTVFDGRFQMLDVLLDALQFLFITPLGLMGKDEAPDDIEKVIIATRVSSRDQVDGSSLDKQLRDLRNKAESLVDPEDIFEVGGDWESAASMDRSHIREIKDLIEIHDKKMCLMVRDVTRLSRASPFEAMNFMFFLDQNDAVLYTHEDGFFDFDEPMHQFILMYQLSQSHKEYKNIYENSRTGEGEALQDGEILTPFYGVERGESDKPVLVEEELAVVERAFEIALRDEVSVSEIHNMLIQEFGDDIVPSYNTLLNILKRPAYHSGKRIHNDEHVLKIDQLQEYEVVSEGEFEQVQDIYDWREESPQDIWVDIAFVSLVENFGLEGAARKLTRFFSPKCPKCGSDAKDIGTGTVWGCPVVRFKCRAPDDECDYEGPIFTEKLLKEFDNALYICCPCCDCPINDPSWVDHPELDGWIQTTCEHCSVPFALPVPTNKYERGFEYPEFAIDLFEWYNEDDEEDEEGDVSGAA